MISTVMAALDDPCKKSIFDNCAINPKDAPGVAPIEGVLNTIGEIILYSAGPLIIISFLISAFLWMTSFHHTHRAAKARDWWIRTAVGTAIIGSYFIVKELIMALAGLGS